jgi:transcription factor MYB, plant
MMISQTFPVVWSGLKRCGKSCRLGWLNYLRPELRHGCFTDEEDNLILSLYGEIGSKYGCIMHGKLTMHAYIDALVDMRTGGPWSRPGYQGERTTTSRTTGTPSSRRGSWRPTKEKQRHLVLLQASSGDSIAAAATERQEQDDGPLPRLPSLVNLDTAIIADNDDELLVKSEQLYYEFMDLIEQESMSTNAGTSTTTESFTVASASSSGTGTSPAVSSSSGCCNVWPMEVQDTALLPESQSEAFSTAMTRYMWLIRCPPTPSKTRCTTKREMVRESCKSISRF